MFTTHYKDFFKSWYFGFQNTSIFCKMLETQESSSWHKEANVGVHTDMVVDSYCSSISGAWSKKDFLGAIYCAFHDTGKPKAEEVTTSDDGVSRKKYSGHEIFSARLFVDYVYSDTRLLCLLDERDIYNIAVMIQSHIPYSLRTEKMRQLKTHLCAFGLDQVFTRCLMADTRGRISDDQENKIVAAENWIRDIFNPTEPMTLVDERVPLVTLMCAPTGAGKTTVVNKIAASYKELGKKVGVHSLDWCRLNWYSKDYEEAFRLATADSQFDNKAMRDFWDKAKANDVVIVDNTNTSPKRRKRYIVVNTHAVVFLLDYQTNYARCRDRQDKTIGQHVLDSMYWNFKLPILGEVDKIFIISRMEGIGICMTA